MKRVKALLSVLAICVGLTAICGCSNKAEVTAPEAVVEPVSADCAAPLGYCFAVQFIGFPEYSEDPLVFLKGEGGAYIQEDIQHPELRDAFAFGSWYVGATCTNSFMYMDPYSDNGGILFPPGSKYEKFSLSWKLLCADIKGCSSNPYFFDIRELTWGGKVLAVHDSLGEVIPNQTFRINEHGKGGAVLHVAEIVESSRGALVRGIRMELPGKKSVAISVTAQECP